MSLAQVTAFWLSFGEEGKVGSDLGGARLSLSCTDGKLPTETPRTQRLVRKRSGTKIPFYVPFYTILQFLRIFGEYSLVEVQLLAAINSTARTFFVTVLPNRHWCYRHVSLHTATMWQYRGPARRPFFPSEKPRRAVYHCRLLRLSGPDLAGKSGQKAYRY